MPALREKVIDAVIDDLPEQLEVDVDQVEEVFDEPENRERLNNAILTEARNILTGETSGKSSGMLFNRKQQKDLGAGAYYVLLAAASTKAQRDEGVDYLNQAVTKIEEALEAT